MYSSRDSADDLDWVALSWYVGCGRSKAVSWNWDTLVMLN